MVSAIIPSVFVLRRYDVNVVLMSSVILPMLDAIMSVVVPLWTNDVVNMDFFIRWRILRLVSCGLVAVRPRRSQVPFSSRISLVKMIFFHYKSGIYTRDNKEHIVIFCPQQQLEQILTGKGQLHL
jgi:hypothetical protein